MIVWANSRCTLLHRLELHTNRLSTWHTPRLACIAPAPHPRLVIAVAGPRLYVARNVPELPGSPVPVYRLTTKS
jgi:hypothetical protein